MGEHPPPDQDHHRDDEVGQERQQDPDRASRSPHVQDLDGHESPTRKIAQYTVRPTSSVGDGRRLPRPRMPVSPHRAYRTSRSAARRTRVVSRRTRAATAQPSRITRERGQQTRRHDEETLAHVTAWRRGRCRSIAAASLPPSRREGGLLGLEGQAHALQGVGRPGQGPGLGFEDERGHPPEIERRQRPQEVVPREPPLVVGHREVRDHASPQRRREAEVFGPEEPERVELTECLVHQDLLPQGEEVLQAEMERPDHPVRPDVAGRRRRRARLASSRDWHAPAHVLPLRRVALHEAEERPDRVHEGVGQVAGRHAGIELLPPQVDLDDRMLAGQGLAEEPHLAPWPVGSSSHSSAGGRVSRSAAETPAQPPSTSWRRLPKSARTRGPRRFVVSVPS